MKLTTLEVIKILPFDDVFKQQLLEKFPLLSEDIKYEVVELIWDLYYAMYEVKFEENTDKAFLRAEKNQETLDNNFYKRVTEQTGKEMQQTNEQTSTHVNLSQTRQKLQEILNKPSGDMSPTN